MISRGTYLTEYVEVPIPNGNSIRAYIFEGEYYYNIGDICKSITRKRNLERVRLDDRVKFELMRDTKKGRRISWFTNKYGLFDIVFGIRGEGSFEIKKYFIDNIDTVIRPNLLDKRDIT